MKKRIVKLTESDLTRLVKKVIKENKNNMKKEDLIYSKIDSAIETNPQEDYTDVFDWMNVIFSEVESELEDVLDEDEIEDIRSDYDGYVMGHWESNDEE